MKPTLLLLALLPAVAAAQALKPRPTAWGYLTGQLTYPVPDLPAKQRVLRVTAIPVAGYGRSY